jgi:hypothetical protein
VPPGRVSDYLPGLCAYRQRCIYLFIYFVVYLTMLFFSNSDYTALNERMISESPIGKDMERSSHGLI